MKIRWHEITSIEMGVEPNCLTIFSNCRVWQFRLADFISGALVVSEITESGENERLTTDGSVTELHLLPGRHAAIGLWHEAHLALAA